MRRCGAIGAKRINSRPNWRELEYTAETRWLYMSPPNPYNPYVNLYGPGPGPPPPPPPFPPPRPPQSPMQCSCDDDCLNIEYADCCNDYQMLCVFD